MSEEKKCLVTTLQGVVDNDELLKIGECRLRIRPTSIPTSESYTFKLVVSASNVISFSKPVYINNIGGDLVTSFTATAGQNWLITSQDLNDFDISIENKYAVTAINISNARVISGDITYLSQLKILTFSPENGIPLYLGFNGIGYLEQLKHLDDRSITSAKIVYKESPKFNNSTNSIALSYADFEKGLTLPVGLPSLLLFEINHLTKGIENPEDICRVSANPNCEQIRLFRFPNTEFDTPKFVTRYLSFASYGTISPMIEANSFFVWGEGAEDANPYILGAEKVIFKTSGDLDRFLIAQAAKELHPASVGSLYYKRIDVLGTRTSASDAAVATLQSKGITIQITNY